MRIMITGMAGFVGYHLAKHLALQGHNVIGVDNFNRYYSTDLKYDRSHMLRNKYDVECETIDISDPYMLRPFMRFEKPDMVIHLAAYAGVRHSLDNPSLYHETNIVGTQNIIDACKECGIETVLYASTSAVMANNDTIPWNEQEPPKHMLNPYAYSKYVNECQFMMSGIPNTIGLRFFTVYGPWGRPDMALYTFTNNIIIEKPITVYNDGDMKRDFTYVDDIVQGIQCVIDANITGHDIINIGRGEQVQLMDFIHLIEKYVGKKATIDYQPMHPADSKETWSDISKLKLYGYRPKIDIETGVETFVDWYKYYFGDK